MSELVTATTEPITAAGTTPLLELRDIHAGYGPFRSLFGISVTIPPRSVLALLGANGSGKTTVVRVASGLIKPTQGHLLFEGDQIEIVIDRGKLEGSVLARDGRREAGTSRVRLRQMIREGFRAG